MENFETLAKSISTIVGVLIAGNAVMHIELNSRLAKLRPNTTNLMVTITNIIFFILALGGILCLLLGLLSLLFMTFNLKWQLDPLFLILTGIFLFSCAIFVITHDSTEAEIFLEHEHILFCVTKVTKEKVFLEEIFPKEHPQFSKYLNAEEAILKQEPIDFLDDKSLATYNAKKLSEEAKNSSYYEIVSKKFVGL